MVGRVGFEPTKAEPTDLQSVPFDRYGTDPLYIWSRCADSNRRPTPYHGVALPTELQRLIAFQYAP